jgi:hypothetical protein
MTSNLPFEVKRLDGRFTHFYLYKFRYYLHFEHYEKKVVDTIEGYLKDTYGYTWSGTSSWARNTKMKAGWDAQFPYKKSSAYRIYLRDEDMLNYVMMIL